MKIKYILRFAGMLATFVVPSLIEYFVIKKMYPEGKTEPSRQPASQMPSEVLNAS